VFRFIPDEGFRTFPQQGFKIKNISNLFIEKMLYNCTIKVPYYSDQLFLSNFDNFLKKHKTLSTLPIPINTNNSSSSSSSSSNSITNDYEEEGSSCNLPSSPFSNFNKLFYNRFPTRSSLFYKSQVQSVFFIKDKSFFIETREELASFERKSLEYEKMNNDLTVLETRREKLGSEVNKESSVVVNQRFKNQRLSRLSPVEKNDKGYIENLLKCRESSKVNDEKIEKLKKLDLLIKQKEEEIVTYSSELEEEKLKLYCKIYDEAEKRYCKIYDKAENQFIKSEFDKNVINMDKYFFKNSFMYNNFYKDYPKQNIMKITS